MGAVAAGSIGNCDGFWRTPGSGTRWPQLTSAVRSVVNARRIARESLDEVYRAATRRDEARIERALPRFLRDARGLDDTETALESLQNDNDRELGERMSAALAADGRLDDAHVARILGEAVGLGAVLRTATVESSRVVLDARIDAYREALAQMTPSTGNARFQAAARQLGGSLLALEVSRTDAAADLAWEDRAELLAIAREVAPRI